MAREVDTTKISGGADYAKVADRLKQFRTDFPKGKTETDDKEIRDFEGNYLYTKFYAWIWKDKTEYIEIVKSGVTDKDTLRSTADADGAAKGKVGEKEKDFEKLSTIAQGRALASLGYMASGEIASFEEMEEYLKDKREQEKIYVQEEIDKLDSAKTLDELKQIWKDTNKSIPEILIAKDKRKLQLESKDNKQKLPAPKPKKEEKADAKA